MCYLFGDYAILRINSTEVTKDNYHLINTLLLAIRLDAVEHSGIFGILLT